MHKLSASRLTLGSFILFRCSIFLSVASGPTLFATLKEHISLHAIFICTNANFGTTTISRHSSWPGFHVSIWTSKFLLAEWIRLSFVDALNSVDISSYRCMYSDRLRTCLPGDRNSNPVMYRIFLFCTLCIQIPGPVQPLNQRVRELIFRGVKRSNREAGDSPETCASVKKTRIYTSTSNMLSWHSA